jgi:hypothetical protein
VALLGWAAAACASTPVSAPVDFSSPGVGTEAVAPTARMPREIQLGAVDMVIQRVEPEVSRGEIAADRKCARVSALADDLDGGCAAQHVRRTLRFDDPRLGPAGGLGR